MRLIRENLFIVILVVVLLLTGAALGFYVMRVRDMKKSDMAERDAVSQELLRLYPERKDFPINDLAIENKRKWVDAAQANAEAGDKQNIEWNRRAYKVLPYADGPVFPWDPARRISSYVVTQTYCNTLIPALLERLVPTRLPTQEEMTVEEARVKRYREVLRRLKKLDQPAEAAEPPALIAALKDQVPSVRSSAALALGQIGLAGEGVVPALIAALADADPRVRSSAALALGQVGPAAGGVMPALIAALADNDPGVRSSAAAAVREGKTEKEIALDNMRLTRARAGRVFVSPGSLDLYIPRPTPGLGPAELWRAQLNYWVQLDIVEAIRATNERAFAGRPANVLSAAVKELAKIDVEEQYLLRGGQGDSSLTGRHTCKDYEVLRYRLEVIMSERYFLELIGNLVKQNLHTVMGWSMQLMELTQEDGRYFGRDPVMRVEIHGELVLLTAWERGTMEGGEWVHPPLIPEEVLKALPQDVLREADKKRIGVVTAGGAGTPK